MRVVSPIFLSSPISPMLMTLSLTLIGVVFMLSYTGGMMGWLIVNAGMKRIKCKLKPSDIGGMTEFVQRFYEFKLGYNRESSPVTPHSEHGRNWPALRVR